VTWLETHTPLLKGARPFSRGYPEGSGNPSLAPQSLKKKILSPTTKKFGWLDPSFVELNNPV